MRVIAGTFRSRPLLAPRGALTRPTSDRLRETLFNVLAQRIPGARLADLYAGTGAVGIEALSRGAREVLFAERGAPAVAALRSNLQALGIVSSYVLESRSVAAALDRALENAVAPFDLVFLDPPYEGLAEYSATLSLLGSSRGSRLLSPGALVIAEHSSKSPLPESFGSLRMTRTLKQGDASLSFFAAETGPESAEKIGNAAP